MASDLAALQGFSLSSDVQQLNGDTSQANSDLGTVKTDAASGPGQFCGNVDTVGGDADTVLGDQDTVSGDEQVMSSDVSTGNGDISAVQADVKTLQSLGLPVPAGVQGAISSAQGHQHVGLDGQRRHRHHEPGRVLGQRDGQRDGHGCLLERGPGVRAAAGSDDRVINDRAVRPVRPGARVRGHDLRRDPKPTVAVQTSADSCS
jgi:hypothetical protein